MRSDPGRVPIQNHNNEALRLITKNQQYARILQLRRRKKLPQSALHGHDLPFAHHISVSSLRVSAQLGQELPGFIGTNSAATGRLVSL